MSLNFDLQDWGALAVFQLEVVEPSRNIRQIGTREKLRFS